MFEYLRGYVVEVDVNSSYIVLDVNGIGYLIYVSNSIYYRNKNELVKIFVHQVVTDSFQLLYGFKNKAEKAIFEKLIDVSGIGPKSALAILAGNHHNDLLHAIENENVNYLKKFPGVGNKTAKQIILDLQDKIKDLLPSESLDNEFKVGSSMGSDDNQELNNALEALKALGYTQRDIKQIQPQLEKMQQLNTNQYLSQGLSLLNARFN